MYGKRKKYIDTLKLLAIFGVISLHIFQIWNQRLIFNIDIIYGCSEISRFWVPLFLMISGALLLNREIELVSFIKKNGSG